MAAMKREKEKVDAGVFSVLPVLGAVIAELVADDADESAASFGVTSLRLGR